MRRVPQGSTAVLDAECRRDSVGRIPHFCREAHPQDRPRADQRNLAHHRPLVQRREGLQGRQCHDGNPNAQDHQRAQVGEFVGSLEQGRERAPQPHQLRRPKQDDGGVRCGRPASPVHGREAGYAYGKTRAGICQCAQRALEALPRWRRSQDVNADQSSRDLTKRK